MAGIGINPGQVPKMPLFTMIKEVMMGFCLGVANIIPGVSGGTFLLVFGIYEKVFAILNQINTSFLARAGRLLWAWIRYLGLKGTSRDLVLFLIETEFLFLFTLAFGAVFAIGALSGVMKFLLLNHFSLTYALFFGLILVSMVIPFKMVNKFTGATLVFMILGMGLTIYVTWMVNPYDKIKVKSDYLEQRYQAAHVSVPDSQIETVTKSRFSFTGRYTPDEFIYIGICGALAISATVLPGISGSLVLILMGAYFDVISAVSSLKTFNLDTIAYLGVFGLGVMLGGLLFARLVSFVLSRYYNPTMGFLIGLMTGSLYALWPFKHTVVMARQYVKQAGEILALENITVQTNINVLPGREDPLAASLFFFILGGIIMAGFVKAEAAKAD